jgi:hypothetical protein
MTDQLHDLLTRIADQAGPGGNDPTVWDRARRARRRERVLRASAAAALAAVALAGAVAIGFGARSAPPPANENPNPHKNGIGIPSTVRGIHGDGGLDLETHLAVGPASVAIANHSGAFVITAADGVYHRLRLPGFDPQQFDQAHPGLALSPDGTRLAYSWRANNPRGPNARPRVGTRILDLRTGALQKIPGTPGHVVDVKVPVSPYGLPVSPYGYDWSPNGRYLVFETVVETQTPDPADAGPAHWYAGINTATGRYFLFSTETRPASCAIPDCRPMTVADTRRIARVDPSSDPRGPTLVGEGTRLPEPADWNVGRFTPDGRRMLLQPDGVGTGIVLVTDTSPRSYNGPHQSQTALLTLDSGDWPDGAKIDVLGWVAAHHALAMVNRGTGPDTAGTDGDLVLVDLSSVSDTTTENPLHLDVVGHVDPSDAGSAYSFATDFATVDAPTQDFDQP